MLTRSAKDRITIPEALAHPWFVITKPPKSRISTKILKSLKKFYAPSKLH